MELKEMTIEQLEARKSEIITELESPEVDLDALENEARSIKEEIENRKAEESKKAEIRAEIAKGSGEVVQKFTEEKKTMPSIKEIRESQEYINAYADAIRRQDANFTECRTLLTENCISTAGTVPVPWFVADIVAEAVKASPILNRIRRMEAPGNVSVGFEISAPAAGVHAEGGEAMAEEELVLGIAQLIPETYKKWVSISDEALDSMSGEAYLRYIYDEVTRGIIKARENAVVAAILAAPQTSTTQPTVPKTGVAGGAINDFVVARALLSSAATDLVIICSPAQYAFYRGLQLQANYGADPFDGLEVLFSDAATVPIIGDLKGVMENLPRGENIEFKYDDRTRMKQDLVDVLGRLPAAIALVGNKYFAKVDE